MTLEEAIRHCEEVASENDSQAAEYNENDEWEFANKCNCEQCAADHRQLAEWLTELKEAKRLLKAAVEDFSNMYDHIFDCDGMCDTCPLHGERDNCLVWRYADEAENLLNDEK